MGQVINDFISALFQVVVFTLIPFIFFLFRKAKSETFSQYIGWYRPPSKAIVYACGASLLFLIMGIGLVFTSDGFRQAVLAPASTTGKIRSMGFNTVSVLSLLIMTCIKTSLSEEIFFRGFLAKRLINKLGTTTGNIVQAIIFGLMHFFLVWILVKATLITSAIIFIFSSFAGWAVGYVKVKYANGSIIPGWIAHGLGNTISYAIIAFVI